MNEFPKKEHVIGLIEEAVGRAAQLGEYKNNLTPDFRQAQNILETLAELKSQQALLLAAARRMITQVEKKTITLIIGDDPITGQQMSHLVRIRVICSELIELLTTIMERVKKSVEGPGIAGAGG